MMLPTGTDFVLRILSGEELHISGPNIQAVPVAFAGLDTLWPRALAAQQDGKTSGDFGQFFFDALPPVIRRALQQAARHATIGWPPRLIVAGGPTTRAQFLPWEALRFGVEEYPQATRRLRILRWVQAPPLFRDPLRQTSADRWRVLILVGDVRQEWGKQAAEPDLGRALNEITKALKPPVELKIAGPAWLAERHPELPWDPFERLDQLFTILQRSWHAVHFLGHSDGLAPASGLDAITGDAPTAQNLLFQLDADADSPPAPWPISTLVTSLRYTNTRVLVLGACLTQEHLAAPLLEVVDHVIGNQARVSAQVAADFCGPFYQSLSSVEPVSSAVAAAHGALHEQHPDEFWIPALWTHNLDDQPLLDPDSLTLRTHADDVAARVSRLPGPLTAGLRCDDVLANVYVELDVLPDEEGRLRRAQIDKVGKPAGPHERQQDWAHLVQGWPHATRMTLERVVRERQIGWLSGRYYLFGHAADGKTTALRHLTHTLTGQRPLQVLPCLHTLQDVVDGLRPARPEGPWWNQISGEVVLQHLLDQVPGKPVARLRELRNQGRLMVLLDSLDEVAEAERDAARRVVDVLDQVLGTNVLVVASRAIGFVGRHQSRFRAIVLQGLLPEDRDQLVRRWCEILWRDQASFPGLRPIPTAHEFAQELLDQIHHSPGLRRATTNPLTVALLVRLAAETEPPAGHKVAQLPKRREALYRACIRFLLGCSHRRREPVPDEALDAGVAVLRRLAWWLLEQGRTTLQQPSALQRGLGMRDEAAAWFAQEDAALTVAGAPWRDGATFRDWLQGPAGLFVDKGGGALGFAPKVFQDALAAEALVERFPAVGDLIEFVRRQLGATPGDQLKLWGEGLALVTRQLPSSDQRTWLDGLRRIDHALALRALAGADLDEETVRWFFGWSDHAGERKQIITALGAWLEDDGDLRSAIETVAGCTTDGEDLWHLYELLRERGMTTEVIDARLLAMSTPTPETWHRQFKRIPTPKEILGQDWFVMGSPETEPDRYEDEAPHEVVLSQPFHLGQTPVTVAQYLEFDPSHRQWCFDAKAMRPATELARDLPVTDVSWFEARMFARWLELHRLDKPALWREILPEGFCCQLPTEAQWEWAIRAGTRTRFWSGDKVADLERVGWFDANSDGRSHRADRDASPWGLRDMHGNVWEWCHDRYGHYPADRTTDPGRSGGGGAPGRGPARPDPLGQVGRCVMRGGAYWAGAGWCRSAARGWQVPDGASRSIGFRLALSAPRLGD